MPGIIQVSVLDLMGLPSSSMSVKVSMGKREHQILDKGEFSFPLITLRENLIVTLYDSEGNELSQTGVNTKLVVEKGFWDDLFPLQGGGHLHMKLQFILSEEDRRRIREMRESALRKKQQELLINSKRSSETAAVDIVGPLTEAAFNHEKICVKALFKGKLQALQRELFMNDRDREGASSETIQQILVTSKTLPPPKDIPTKGSSSQNQTPSIIRQISMDKLPKNNETDGEGVSSEATPPMLPKIDFQLPAYNTTMPNSSDNQNYSTMRQILTKKTPMDNEIDREGSSSVVKLPQALEVSNYTKTTQKVMEKSDIQSLPTVVPSRSSSSKEIVGTSTFSVDEKIVSTSSSLPESQMHSTGRQTAFGRTPSNVQKMISALECSSSQGKLSHANAPELKPHLRKVKSEVALKGPSINEAKKENAEAKNQILEREFNSYSIRKPLDGDVLQHVPNRAKTEVSLKGPDIHEATMENSEVKKQVIRRKLNPFPGRKPLEVTVGQNVKNVRSQKQILLDDQTVRASDRLHLSLSSRTSEVLGVRPAAVEGNNTSERLDCTTQTKMENMIRQESLLEEFAVISEAQMAKNSQHIPDDPVERGHPLTLQQTVRAADRSPISQTSGQLELLDARPSAVEGTNSGEQVNCHIRPEIVHLNRKETLLEEFVVASAAETAIMSEGTHTLHFEQQHSALNVLTESGPRTSQDKTENINSCGTSLGKRKSLEYAAGEQSHEVMGSWTLPDARRRMCITTASKQIMKFMGFDSCRENNQGETSLPRIGVKEVPVDSCISLEVNESGMTPHNLRKLKTEKSKDDSVPGGIIGQAVRVAIMVAFGTLVIVTRQTRNR